MSFDTKFIRLSAPTSTHEQFFTDHFLKSNWKSHVFFWKLFKGLVFYQKTFVSAKSLWELRFFWKSAKFIADFFFQNNRRVWWSTTKHTFNWQLFFHWAPGNAESLRQSKFRIKFGFFKTICLLAASMVLHVSSPPR